MTTEVQGGAQVTWFYQGSSLTSNTTISLSSGDTFTAQCKGAGGGSVHAESFAEICLTKSYPATADSLAWTENTPGVPITGVLSQGSMVYNLHEGLLKGFDHWQVSVSIFDVGLSGVFASGVLQVSIPRVTSLDAGTYYCAFYDGTNIISETTLVHSVGLTLSVTTQSGSSSINTASNRMFGYSFALISAMKVLY